jgi:SPP1 family predicted phage head-tail adaptor
MSLENGQLRFRGVVEGRQAGTLTNLIAKYACDEGAGLVLTDSVGNYNGTVDLSDGQWSALGLERTVTAAGTPLVTLPFTMATQNPILTFVLLVKLSEASTVINPLQIATPGPVVELSLTADPSTSDWVVTSTTPAVTLSTSATIANGKWLVALGTIDTTGNAVYGKIAASDAVFEAGTASGGALDQSDATAISIGVSGKHTLANLWVYSAALTDDDFIQVYRSIQMAVDERPIRLINPLYQDSFDQDADVWTAVKTVWMDIRALNAFETERARQVVPETTHVIKTRYFAELKHDMRIVFDNRRFYVRRIFDRSHRKQEYEIWVTERDQ